jgi:urease accessory protein
MDTATNLTTCFANGQASSRIALLQAFDSLFPTGAYTMSGGMETYTQKGLVHDKNSLVSFLKSLVYILPYGDLGVCAKTAGGEDFHFMDEICSAMKQPFEIRTGSEKLCLRFLKMQETLYEYPSLASYYLEIQQKKCSGHYPVAIGLFIRDLNADLDQALEMYCYSLLSQAVNHAVKLIPLGQSDGQAALFEAMRLIPSAVQKAKAASINELGVSACGFDLRSMQHETLHGRLYIT